MEILERIGEGFDSPAVISSSPASPHLLSWSEGETIG